MKTLKKHITQFCQEKGWGTDKDTLFEVFENRKIVWRGEPDAHRWYTNYDVVHEVEIDGEKRYFEWYEMRVDGEGNSREDCGFEIPDLDEITEVFPKEVVATVYVTKDKL